MLQLKPLLLVFYLALLSITQAQNLPPGVVNVPPTAVGDSVSIGSSTTLNVLNGGVIDGSLVAGLDDGTSTDVAVYVQDGASVGRLSAYWGSTVEVDGGSIGSIASFGSYVNVNDGEIERIDSWEGGTVDIWGGDVGVATNGYPCFCWPSDGTLNIYGGSISSVSSGGILAAPENGIGTNIVGGAIEDVQVFPKSTLNWSGGAILGVVAVEEGAMLTIVGTEFHVDGSRLPLIPGEQSVVTGRNVVLSGRLADGGVFQLDLLDQVDDRSLNSFSPNGIVTVVLVPEPSATSVALTGLLLILARRTNPACR